MGHVVNYKAYLPSQVFDEALFLLHKPPVPAVQMNLSHIYNAW